MQTNTKGLFTYCLPNDWEPRKSGQFDRIWMPKNTFIILKIPTCTIDYEHRSCTRVSRGVCISFSWGGGGGVVSKLGRVTDQSMIHYNTAEICWMIIS